jgi:hypothetical protein
MQVNQSGEYTNIGFLFLALLPTVLLFLPFRKKNYAFLIIIFLLLELLVFIKTDNNLIEKEKILNISEQTINNNFKKNTNIFKNRLFETNIYDINFRRYVHNSEIRKLVTEKKSFQSIEKQAKELFYSEMIQKVLDDKL